jgi:TorA maturation chaperone TorD
MPPQCLGASCDPVLLPARQALYRFASLTMLDPRHGAWQRLHALRGTTLLEDAAHLVQPGAARRANRRTPGGIADDALRPGAVLDHLAASAEEHNSQYESVFGLLLASACPPYETEYIAEKFPFTRNHCLADVAGFYRAFGLRLAPGLRERPDHVALQLEFMAFLIGQEHAALHEQAQESTQAMHAFRKAQVRFFREHVSWWVPGYCRLLEQQSPGGFFGQAARFLSAWVDCERKHLGVPPPAQPAVPQPQPWTPVSDEQCLVQIEL